MGKAKRLLCGAVLLCVAVASVTAHAQGGSIWGQVVQPAPPAGTGGPAPYASIRVCPVLGGSGTPCSPLASLYLDPGLTVPTTNPATSDAYGNYSLWVTAVLTGYIVQVTPVNGVTYSYVVGTPAGTGTVSSVGLAMPSDLFSVANSPITVSGVLNVTLLSQPANQVFGNCANAASTPVFCALTAAMIPGTLNATNFNGNVNIGNPPPSGPGIFNVAAANSAYTNTQMYDYSTSLVNGLSPLVEFRQPLVSLGTPGYAVEGAVGGVTLESGSIIGQVNGVAGYCHPLAASGPGLGGGQNCVGVYGQSWVTVNSGAGWGGNTVAEDAIGTNGALLISQEADVNLFGSASRVNGLVIAGVLTGTMPAAPVPGSDNINSGVGLELIPAGQSTTQWPMGIWLARGFTGGVGLLLDASSISGASPSMALYQCGNNGSAAECTIEQADASGNLNISAASGEYVKINNTATPNLAMNSTNGIAPMCSSTLPTVSSGFNGGAVAAANANGTCSFYVTVGSGSATSTGVIGLTSAGLSGWNCFASNATRGALVVETGASLTTATLTNYGTTFAATNWIAGDVILISCFGR